VTYWDDGKRFVPRRNERGTKPYSYFELSLAQGPVAIGVTGQNRLLDFIGTAWLLLLDLDMQLRLFRQTSVGEWEAVTTLLPPLFNAPLPEGARRVSCAFDQAARIVVAYELDSEIFVVRWNPFTNQYVNAGPFAGVDPVVAFDATWSYDVPDSDVILFFLSADRTRLLYRIQREVYAVENELHDYGQPVVLDRVTRLPIRYQVLASDEVGDPLLDEADRVALLSNFYPYLWQEEVAALSVAPPAFGSYVNVVLKSEDSDELLVDGAVAPASGAYVNVVLNYVNADDEVEVDGAVAPSGGLYLYVIIPYEDDDALLVDGGVPPLDGVYQYVILNYEYDDDEVEVDGGTPPSGGSYVLA
jgi:hypothetical protein